MIGSPLARAEEAPGRGTNWGMAAPSPTLPRGTRIKVGTAGTLERISLGPAHVTDGSENLVGALRQSMAALGARTLREMQRSRWCTPRRPRPRASPATGPLTDDASARRPLLRGQGREDHDARAPERPAPGPWRSGMWTRPILSSSPRATARTGRSTCSRTRRSTSRSGSVGSGALAEPLGAVDHARDPWTDPALRHPGREARPRPVLPAASARRSRRLDGHRGRSRVDRRGGTGRRVRHDRRSRSLADVAIASGIRSVHRESDGPPTAGERLVVEQDAAGRWSLRGDHHGPRAGPAMAPGGRDADGVTIDIEAFVEPAAGRDASATELRDDPDRVTAALPGLRVDGLAAGRAGGPARHRRPAHHLERPAEDRHPSMAFRGRRRCLRAVSTASCGQRHARDERT